MYSVSAKIEIVSEHKNAIISLSISKPQAPLIVAYLDALTLGKLRAFCLEDGSKCVSFSSLNGYCMLTEYEDVVLKCTLSENQIEVIKSCCIDGIMNAYTGVHVDFELTGCDFCLSICD